MSVEDWKLCRCNHGHQGKVDTFIANIVEMKEIDNIAVHDHTKTRCINLYPQDDTGDDSDV